MLPIRFWFPETVSHYTQSTGHLGVLLDLRASLPGFGENGADHALRAAVRVCVNAAVRVARVVGLRLCRFR